MPNLVRLVTALMMLFSAMSASRAQNVLRIGDDAGGRFGDYIAKYKDAAAAGKTVSLDGACLGACTIFLGWIPLNETCATEKAALGFRAAFDISADNQRVQNDKATKEMFYLYPKFIKEWIADKGGLTMDYLFLEGKELSAFILPCAR